MSKEKQKIISDICPFYKEYGSCEQCNKDMDIDDPPCYFECIANVIIDNNYVKQSEGEWICFAKDPVGKAFNCSICGYVETTEGFEDSPLDNDCNCCSRCGARMKGGAE